MHALSSVMSKEDVVQTTTRLNASNPAIESLEVVSSSGIRANVEGLCCSNQWSGV